MNLAALLGLAIVAFASTDVDDIIVLIAFFADSRFRTRNVVIGQYLGIGALVIASIAASWIALALTPAFVGLLGALPILIGLKRLADLRHDAGEEGPPTETRNGALGQIGAIAAVTIANGGDNLGVYAPLFATQSAAEIAVMAAVFILMTALWILIAHGLVKHPTIGAIIRRYGRIAAPLALIGLGFRILYNAQSFELLRSAVALIR